MPVLTLADAYAQVLLMVLQNGNVRIISGRKVLEVCGLTYSVVDTTVLPPMQNEAKTYGEFLRHQFPAIIKRLTKDPNTRQAVASVWDHEDCRKKGHVPCTVSMQFLLRDKKLEMCVFSRSSDVINLLPSDMAVFAGFQKKVAKAVKAKLGFLVHMIGSAHIYMDDLFTVTAKKRKTGKTETHYIG